VFEAYQLTRDGARWMGLMIVLGNLLLGYIGVWLGAVITSRQ
jgi:fluoride ion exporter CrcB/FEX